MIFNFKKSLYYKLTDIFVCVYCMYMYICFWKNAKLQPSTSKTVLSLSVSLSFSCFCILWPQTLYFHMGVMMLRLFTTVVGVGLSGGWRALKFFRFFLCQFCIIKLDNCTVLMTSSNILSISVTKSNLDINCVHVWYTPMLFHCLCVWTSGFCFFSLFFGLCTCVS